MMVAYIGELCAGVIGRFCHGTGVNDRSLEGAAPSVAESGTALGWVGSILYTSQYRLISDQLMGKWPSKKANSGTSIYSAYLFMGKL